MIVGYTDIAGYMLIEKSNNKRMPIHNYVWIYIGKSNKAKHYNNLIYVKDNYIITDKSINDSRLLISSDYLSVHVPRSNHTLNINK